MKAVVVLGSTLLLAAAPALAGAHGNWYGHIKAAIEPAPADCPVSIETAGIQDNESQSTAARVFLGPAGGHSTDGSAHAYTVRYDLSLKPTRAGVVAAEFEWTGVNAFGDPQGTRKTSVAWKKPLTIATTKHESDTSDRLLGDVSKYSVRVVRVKFDDGTMWVAPAPAGMNPAPATEEPAKP
jgi:hypothetical protein